MLSNNFDRDYIDDDCSAIVPMCLRMDKLILLLIEPIHDFIYMLLKRIVIYIYHVIITTSNGSCVVRESHR